MLRAGRHITFRALLCEVAVPPGHTVLYFRRSVAYLGGALLFSLLQSPRTHPHKEQPMEYVVVGRLPEPARHSVQALTERVVAITRTLPSNGLPPHLTFQRVATGIPPAAFMPRLERAVAATHRCSVTFEGLDHFGPHYIVLRVRPTQQLGAMWGRIGEALSCLPNFQAEPFASENTLHVTLAAKTTRVFARAWPRVRRMRVAPIAFTLTRLDMYRREDAEWTLFKEFLLPL